MDKKMKFRLLVLIGFSLIFTLIVGLFPVATSAPDNEVNEQREALIIRGVLSALQQLHYEPIELNDDISMKAFKSYIERMDSGKRFLTTAEYNQLKAWEKRIDDEFLTEKFDFFNLSLQIIEQAVQRAKLFYPEILDKPFNFYTDEYVEMDPKKMDFAENEAALKDRWRRLLKYDAMTKLYDKMQEQEKNDTLSVRKTIEELEEEVRKEIKKNMDLWFERTQQIRRSDRFSDYVNAVSEIFDPHSSYFSPKDKEDFNIGMSGRLEGIGARLQSDGEYTKVESIVPGGPAWKQKELEVNDQIIKVKQEEGEALDIRGMRLDDVVKHIRGKKGTRVTLTVRKADGASREITIVRDEVILDEGFAKSAILEHSEIIDNIGYIRLPKFYADFEKQNGNSCSKDVAAEIEKLKKLGVKGIILDLRNNGGGSLRDVVDMSGLFIESGPIVQVKSRNQKPQILSDQDPRVQFSGPLIVMVNTFSASASEILAAAMQDYNRALIVGSPSTFGKGTVQRFYDLDKLIRSSSDLRPFGEIKLTMQKFYRINGGSTQLKGVNPDIVLPDNFMFLDLGEKEYDYPMAWSEIESLKYSQNAFQVSDKKSLVKASKDRINQDSTFVAIAQNAERLKRQREERRYPLHLDQYSQWVSQREEQSKRLEEILDKEVANLKAINLDEDLDYINMDESRVARNDNWLESMRKDIYLKETLNLMRDMIDLSSNLKLTDKK
jgi:carboxyl-terminal processing protease